MKQRARHLLLCTLPMWAVLCLPVHAQNAGTASPQALAPASGLESLLHMLGGLAVVLLLLFGLLKLLRRFGAGQTAAGSAMKLVAGLSVGTRERIVLMEVGDTWVVLGVSPNQINALHTLPRQPLPSAPAPSAPDFRRLLAGFTERKP